MSESEFDRGAVAMLFDAAARSFRRTEFRLPDPQPGEIVIRVSCCTICGSDVHTFSGRRTGPSPAILGHEIIGTIEGWYRGETPKDYFGRELRSGQRVTWNLAVGCGQCLFCERGLPQKCVKLFKYGHAAFADNRSNGGLATHCLLVPGTAIFPISDSVSDAVACPANCATATVCAAVRQLEDLASPAGATILISGMGMLGLTAVALLSTLKADSIICLDPNVDRLRLAERMGGTHTVDTADSGELENLVDQLTDGHGVDALFDFSGANSAIEQGLSRLRVGGAAILAGSVFPVQALSISPETIVRRIWTIRGIHNYGPADLARGITFLEQHHRSFPFAELVSSQFDLEHVSAAFELAAKGSAVRVAVRP